MEFEEVSRIMGRHAPIGQPTVYGSVIHKLGFGDRLPGERFDNATLRLYGTCKRRRLRLPETGASTSGVQTSDGSAEPAGCPKGVGMSSRLKDSASRMLPMSSCGCHTHPNL
jgi:hypothetical protein